jgi:hypothetical protein
VFREAHRRPSLTKEPAMTMIKEPTLLGDTPRFGNVAPSPEAHAELTWFFNGAEQAMDTPSNFCALLSGASPTSMEAVEDRLEAMHAAGKINERLKKVPTTYALLLAGLYTQRVWPAKLQRVLGPLTGAVDSLPTVRAQYLRAIVGAQTRAKSVALWLGGAGGPGRARGRGRLAPGGGDGVRHRGGRL